MGIENIAKRIDQVLSERPCRAAAVPLLTYIDPSDTGSIASQFTSFGIMGESALMTFDMNL